MFNRNDEFDNSFLEDSVEYLYRDFEQHEGAPIPGLLQGLNQVSDGYDNNNKCYLALSIKISSNSKEQSKKPKKKKAKKNNKYNSDSEADENQEERPCRRKTSSHHQILLTSLFMTYKKQVVHGKPEELPEPDSLKIYSSTTLTVLGDLNNGEAMGILRNSENSGNSKNNVT